MWLLDFLTPKPGQNLKKGGKFFPHQIPNVLRWTCPLSIKVQYSVTRYKIDCGNMSYKLKETALKFYKSYIYTQCMQFSFQTIHTDTLCFTALFMELFRSLCVCVCVYHMFCMVIERPASPSQINRVEFIFSLKCEVYIREQRKYVFYQIKKGFHT